MTTGGLARLRAQWRDVPDEPTPYATPQPAWRQVLAVALVGLGIAAAIIGARVVAGPDATGPFMIGTKSGVHLEIEEAGLPLPGVHSLVGYDGQWYLAQALDPLLRTELATTFDSPRYRATRMLLPTAGWLAAAGQPAAIPYAMLALIALAVGTGCAACARILAAHGRSRWWGLLFAFIPGMLVGAAFGTAEPLGLALAAVGISLALDRRYAMAGLAFAGAGLAKENYLAFAAVAALFVAVDGVRRRQPWLRPAALLALPGAGALVAWWGYVRMALPPDPPSPRRGVGAFTVPPTGWGETVGAVLRGEYRPDFPIGAPTSWLIMIGSLALLVAAVMTALRMRHSLLSYVGLAWSMYGLSLIALLLSRFLSAQRALAPAVLGAALLLLAAWQRRSRPPATDSSPVVGHHAA